MALNIFNPPRKDDIKVAYVHPTLGLVRDVSICDANIEAQKNPGTIFIFRDGNQTLKYLNINEVNALNPNDLVPTEECGGITSEKECGPPTIQIFGGGGIGAAGNAVISPTGAVLAVDVIRGGNGYQYAPLASVRADAGVGAVLLAIIGNTSKKMKHLIHKILKSAHQQKLVMVKIGDQMEKILVTGIQRHIFLKNTLQILQVHQVPLKQVYLHLQIHVM